MPVEGLVGLETVDVDGIRWTGSSREEGAMRIREEGVVGDSLDRSSVWMNSTSMEVGETVVGVVRIAEGRTEAQRLFNGGGGDRRQRWKARNRRSGCRGRHT